MAAMPDSMKANLERMLETLKQSYRSQQILVDVAPCPQLKSEAEQKLKAFEEAIQNTESRLQIAAPFSAKIKGYDDEASDDDEVGDPNAVYHPRNQNQKQLLANVTNVSNSAGHPPSNQRQKQSLANVTNINWMEPTNEKAVKLSKAKRKHLHKENEPIKVMDRKESLEEYKQQIHDPERHLFKTCPEDGKLLIPRYNLGKRADV